MKELGTLFDHKLYIDTDDKVVAKISMKFLKKALGPCPICKSREEDFLKSLHVKVKESNEPQ